MGIEGDSSGSAPGAWSCRSWSCGSATLPRYN